jgi:hypothetical protein
MLVSESLRDRVEADDRLSVTGRPAPLTFDEDGGIADWSLWD